jgi:hypothetical protein
VVAKKRREGEVVGIKGSRVICKVGGGLPEIIILRI